MNEICKWLPFYSGIRKIKCMKKLYLLTGLVLLLFSSGLSQQPSDSLKIYSFETSDGNTYIGRIISEGLDSLTIKTENLGILHIPMADIRSRKELKNVIVSKGRYWLPNPQSSRYFWAPNGYGLKRGEVYYQNIWVLYNQVSFGISDHFSLGAGVVPLFLLSSDVSPFWLVPKFSIPLKENKVNLGAGAFLGTMIGEDSGIFGLLYGTTTFGSRDKNMSLGLAYGFAGGEWMTKPIINLSTMVRVGPRGYFISENYILPTDGQLAVMISAGGRTIIRTVGLDYSLWIPIGGGVDRLIALPFLGITIPLK
jgi:hypothetical protein